MARINKKSSNGVVKPKVLATLSEDHRSDFQRRASLVQTKQLEAIAAGAFYDAMVDHMVKFYDLPQKFDLDLDTGIISERLEIQLDNDKIGVES